MFGSTLFFGQFLLIRMRFQTFSISDNGAYMKLCYVA